MAQAGTRKSGASKSVRNTAPLRKQAGNGPAGAVTPEQRYLMVQEAAYYHAQKAGFTGDSVEHWLAAEKEINRRMGGS